MTNTSAPLSKSSLSKDFAIIAILLALSIIATLCWLGWTLYKHQKTDRLYSYSTEGDRLDAALSESFDYVTHYAKFLGEKIIEHGDTDPDYIAELFYSRAQVDPEEQKLYSWTKFDWITPEKQMTVSTKHGVLKEKKDMSMRSYLEETPKHPWKLQFSDPAVGIPSGQWIIPTGVGVKDEQGRFYGTIGTGFSIDRLQAKLDVSPTMPGSAFILLNKTFDIILQSVGKKCDEDELQILRKNIAVISNLDGDAGFLPSPIRCGNIKYIYYRSIVTYPFYFLIGEDIGIVEDRLKDAIIPRAIEFFSIWIFGLLLLYYFKHRLIQPIITISKAAKKIAKGEYVAIPQGHYPEINLLATQLTEIQRVKRELHDAKEEAVLAHEQVKIANESLEEKVHERTLELEKALTAKSEFLNNMSHEIRSPIQGILVFSETLAKDWSHLSEEKRYEYAQNMNENSSRLLSLVTNLLDLSKMDSGKMSYSMKPQNDLAEIIRGVIKECSPLLNAKNLELVLLPPECSTIATCDELRLTQVVRNLIVNAIKFTASGKIIMSITRNYDADKKIHYLKVAIKDEGIGIPENELAEIFTPFAQSSRSKTKAGGTGLGLSIAKQIIEAHHGSIHAENNPGKGATVIFEIPVRQPGEPQVDEPAITPVDNTQIHVLAIDDEDNCLVAMQIYLERMGYKVTTANGGIAGLEAIKAHYATIDLVLLDLMMPDLYGLDLLAEVKATPHLKNIPVILQTGTSDTKELTRAYEIGAIAVLSKPYGRNELAAIVEKGLKDARLKATE
jgi:two-component system, sensor histidine kinase ChiS